MCLALQKLLEIFDKHATKLFVQHVPQSNSAVLLHDHPASQFQHVAAKAAATAAPAPAVALGTHALLAPVVESPEQSSPSSPQEPEITGS